MARTSAVPQQNCTNGQQNVDSEWQFTFFMKQWQADEDIDSGGRISVTRRALGQGSLGSQLDDERVNRH